MNTPLSQRTFFSHQVHFPLILMRHGQAIYTHEEDTGGDIVEGVLSEKGKQTIRHASEEITQELQKHSIASIQLFTSPKNRCIQTTTILQEELQKINILSNKNTVQNLRDVTVIGPQDNIPNSYTRWEENMLSGENWYKAWKRKTKEGMHFFSGEESPEDVKARVQKVLQELLQLQQPTLIVCHEEIMGATAEILDLSTHNPTYGEVWYIYPEKR